MSAARNPWHGQIEQAAQAHWPGLALQWLPSIDSTNTELMRRAALGQSAPALLVADAQTAGRGRLGKRWQSQPGQALTFSLGLPLAPQDWSGLSLVVGMAVVSALQAWARAQGVAASAGRLGLKWPNDVWWIDGAGHMRKMAGILIETASAPQAVAALPVAAASPASPLRQMRYAVIGIGLNLLPQALPEQAGDAAARLHDLGAARVGMASVAEWAGVAPDAGAVLHLLAPAVLSAVRQFEAEGFAAFQPAFAAWDVLAGLPVVLSDGRQGEGLGVDAQGQLLLALGGQVVHIHSGEVSVRPLAQSQPSGLQQEGSGYPCCAS